jgi:DNA replication protein DnaC
MTISINKVKVEKQRIVRNCKKCGGNGCRICSSYCSYIDQLVDVGIPVDYWFRKMEDFYGDGYFKKDVLNYIDNIDEEFCNGLTLCFTGPRGTGKTMAACCILKQVVLKGYTAQYTTMVEAVSKLLAPNSHIFRQSLKYYDFFVIDEVDQRFFPSSGSNELYGNHFENIIRTRTQNRLPTMMCTNSGDIDQIFTGGFRKSFESLRSQFMKILRVGGVDARIGKEKI